MKDLIDAEMADYSDGAYADHGSARDQLTRFAEAVIKREREGYRAAESMDPKPPCNHKWDPWPVADEGWVCMKCGAREYSDEPPGATGSAADRRET